MSGLRRRDPSTSPAPASPSTAWASSSRGERLCPPVPSHLPTSPPTQRTPFTSPGPPGEGRACCPPWLGQGRPCSDCFCVFFLHQSQSSPRPQTPRPRSSVWNASEASILDKRKASPCVSSVDREEVVPGLVSAAFLLPLPPGLPTPHAVCARTRGRVPPGPWGRAWGCGPEGPQAVLWTAAESGCPLTPRPGEPPAVSSFTGLSLNTAITKN